MLSYCITKNRRKMEAPKTYIISWYGPFHSIDEVKEFEQNQNITSNLYLLQGKRKHAKFFSYYCGKTERSASIRLKDKFHCICEIPNHLNIWIGVFDNSFEVEDVHIAENMLIYLLSNSINENYFINDRSKNFTSPNSVCLINRWHNHKHYKQPENSIKLEIPEIVVYNAGTGDVKVSKRLRFYDRIQS